MGQAFIWIGFYAGILALIGVALGFMAAITRGQTRVSLGFGDSDLQLLRSRRFMNFMEWVPFAIVMMVLAAPFAPLWAVHAAGIALVFGRAVHPFGLKVDNPMNVLRFVGTVLSMIVIAGAALFAIHGAITRVM